VQQGLKQMGRSYEVLDPTVFHRRNLASAARLLKNASADSLHLCKGHWSRKHELDLLFSFPQVRVLVIWRDIFDAMVSAYFYLMRSKHLVFRSFEDFYFRDVGRFIFCEQTMARHEFAGRPIVETKFERLATAFETEAESLLSAIGVDGVDLNLLRESVAIPTLRERHDDRDGVFFRGAGVGASQSFDFGAGLDDMKRLMEMPPHDLAALTKRERIRSTANALLYRAPRMVASRCRAITAASHGGS
jgi:hypothetical protein